MEKYGVWIDESHTKTAGTKCCPRCGSKNITMGTVPRCGNCGTAPWEKRANAKKENSSWKLKRIRQTKR